MPATFGHGIQHLDRKQKKPLMEKRRRARINKCLHDLKGLLLESLKRDPAHTSKLEKADILEMTVLLLKDQQRRQLATAVSIDSTVFDRYLGGWAECLSQVVHYANSVDGFNPEIRQRMVQHLESTYRTLIANKQMISGGVPPNHMGAGPLPPVSKLFPGGGSTPPVRSRPAGNPWGYVIPGGNHPALAQTQSYGAGFPFRGYNEIMGLITAMEGSKLKIDSVSSPTDNEANTSKSESENSGQSREIPSYDDVTDPGSNSSVFGGDELADVEDMRSGSRSSSVDVGNSELSTPLTGNFRKEPVWRPW